MNNRRRAYWILLVLLLTTLTLPATNSGIRAERANSKSKAVQWSDLPTTVKTAVARATRGAEIRSIEQGRVGGRRAFAVRASKKRVAFRLTFDARGQLLSFHLDNNEEAVPGQVGRASSGNNNDKVAVAAPTRDDDDKDNDKDGDDDQDEGGRRLTLGKTPPAVRKALIALARPAVIKKVEVAGKADRLSYEAEWRTSTGWREARVASDGQLLVQSQHLSRRQLPSAVRRVALKTPSNKNEIEFEKKVFVFYEIEFEKGKREYHILVDARGRRVEIEYDKDD